MSMQKVSYVFGLRFSRNPLTRAREWGPELRALEGGGAESAPLPTQLL